MSKQITFTVEGMSCSHCEMAVVNAVKTLPNVREATASHENKNVVITYEGELDNDEVKRMVGNAGYKVTA
jgi:copper chaperone